jgi:hypothetical protein
MSSIVIAPGFFVHGVRHVPYHWRLGHRLHVYYVSLRVQIKAIIRRTRFSDFGVKRWIDFSSPYFLL